MPSLIRPKVSDPQAHLQSLFLRTEKKLVDEIARKLNAGYVDYAERAALKRVQETLRTMEDECFTYVPRMVQEKFIKSNKDLYGYSNAEAVAGLSASQLTAIERLVDNLLGQIDEAAAQTFKSTHELMTLGRLENDPFRTAGLAAAAQAEALGAGSLTEVTNFVTKLETDGITAFVDKAGRHWSLRDYGNMAVRTTARQAEVSAVLTADDWDLWQIVKIGSTCPLCAVYEGRVYSKSGTNPNYPPLAMAFGKIDPAGGNDLSNTYLNIHPNCLHSLIKFTEMGKSDKQLQKIREFSSPITNPTNIDPRTKKQREAYNTKVANRAKLLRDRRQYEAYSLTLGEHAPKSFEKFRELKYNEPEKWKYTQGLNKYLKKYPTSDKKYYDVGVKLKEKGIKLGVALPPVMHRAYILPEGKRDPAHIMKRMMERNITDDDLRSYVEKAKVMIPQWSGQRRFYIGDNGCCVITKDGDIWKYKTAWAKEDNTENIDTVLEVLKDVGLR
ncbi:MAG: minor capsid protein [Oscillospiraceae bacterium]|nr:minor capsid protein [Oscillospiraceae bacterium]